MGSPVSVATRMRSASSSAVGSNMGTVMTSAGGVSPSATSPVMIDGGTDWMYTGSEDEQEATASTTPHPQKPLARPRFARVRASAQRR